MDDADLEEHSSHLAKELSPVDEHTVSDHSRQRTSDQQQQLSTAVVNKRATVAVVNNLTDISSQNNINNSKNETAAARAKLFTPGHQQSNVSLSRQHSAPTGPNRKGVGSLVPANQGKNNIL